MKTLLALILMICSLPSRAETVTDSPPPANFTSLLESTCRRYTQIEPGELMGMIRDLQKSDFPVEDYFQTAGCVTHNHVSSIKAPLIHLTADLPCSRAQFPKIIHRYYVKKMKTPQLWLATVNAQNTAGETFLDYLEWMKLENQYQDPEVLQCTQELIKFACETGGTYAKYKQRCSPAPG